MLKKIKFKGGFFNEEKELKLFMNEDRISVLYGKNGSGKSTISNAVRKAKGDVVDDIIQATLLDEKDMAFVDTQCIHVFNEDYVSSRVKIRDDGLNAIILLGELGNLEDKILDLELRIEAESKRNAELKTVAGLKRNLTNDNAAIAHYEVSSDIKLWKQALGEQKKADEALKESDEKIKNLNDELNTLKSRKKNIKIAVSLINKSLRFVFFSKDRLEIKVEGDKYVLYAHGKVVKPNNVSVGERNIIALCYFFTELIMNQEAKDGYSKKLILVIDDPISSFDFENKVGIMSLLKAKVADIIKTNPESQILVMTHDIQCLYDLQKIGEEVCIEYKRESNGQKKVTYACCELKNKEIIPFSYTKRNEYSEILKAVYDYACGKNANDTLTVGNLMRRVMEAFSTFVYKKGIVEISCDDTILQQIGDKDYIDYFKNLMYRLVLNGDSHMLERTNSLDDMYYLNFLSDEERRRTAQEVICFVYLLNKRHVLAHLEGKQNIETNIQKWCADIKSFCAGDEVTV